MVKAHLALNLVEQFGSLLAGNFNLTLHFLGLASAYEFAFDPILLDGQLGSE